MIAEEPEDRDEIVAPNVADAEEVEKRDPALNRFDQWMSLFTHPRFIQKSHGSGTSDIAMYAHCLNRMRVVRVDDWRQVPIMAVMEKEGKHVLAYNPKWMANVGYTEFVTTLCHEALHIFHRDIPRFLRRMALFPEEMRGQVHRVLNFSADAANNDLLLTQMSHMKYDKSGGWILSKPHGLPPRQSMETYFDLIWARRDRIQPMIDQMVQDAVATLQEMFGGEDGDEEQDGQGGGENEDGDGDGKGQGEGEDEEKEDDQEGRGQGEGQSKLESIAKAMAQLSAKNCHDWVPKSGAKTSNGDPLPASAVELEVRASMLDGDAKHLIKAAAASHQKNRGTVPAHLQKVLDEILAEGVVPWTDILRRNVQARVLSKRKKTMTRPHKRRHVMHEYDEELGELVELAFPEPVFPGARRNRTYMILYAVDTSGSMSEQDVMEGLGEIQNLLRQEADAHCVVVQCDTRISDISVLGPNEDVKQYVKRVGRTSYGGTTFNDPFRLARYVSGFGDPPEMPVEQRRQAARLASRYERVDLVVYHTDGYAPLPPKELHPGCHVIWCITANGVRPGTAWGSDNNPMFGICIER